MISAVGIEKCREAALEVLKPTQAQLEHGLALHRESLVWDSYGFMPSGPAPAEVVEKIAEKVKSGAGRDEILFTLEQGWQLDSFANEEIRAKVKTIWQEAGVCCVFQNTGEESSSMERILLRLARFTAAEDFHRDIIQRAALPEDVIKAHKEKRHVIYKSANGVPIAFDPTDKEHALRYLTVFFQLGIRMMHLTYNRRNLIGDGCAEPCDGGLSEFGRDVIGEMNRVGIIPDVAHSGQRTSLEAAECSRKPAVASHSGARGVFDHPRAKSDDVIKAIARSGGYVGVCAYPPLLGGSGMIDSFLDHICYIAEKAGTDHVAIGTDYGSWAADPPGYTRPVIPGSRPAFESFWGSISKFKTTPQMFRTLEWTNWPLFTVGLVQRGFSDEEIRNIIGGNVLRVVRETLKDTKF